MVRTVYSRDIFFRAGGPFPLFPVQCVSFFLFIASVSPVRSSKLPPPSFFRSFFDRLLSKTPERDLFFFSSRARKTLRIPFVYFTRHILFFSPPWFWAGLHFFFSPSSPISSFRVKRQPSPPPSSNGEVPFVPCFCVLIPLVLFRDSLGSGPPFLGPSTRKKEPSQSGAEPAFAAFSEAIAPFLGLRLFGQIGSCSINPFPSRT